MSMTMCAACEQIQDSDFVQFDEILGEQVCESCWPDEEESIVPQPRTALFRLAAALSIAEFTAPTDPLDPRTVRGFHAIRPADDIAPELDWPATCFVCDGPTRSGYGNYCSEAHRKLDQREPTMQEQALDL